jgi:very-short-patch-repair endonuclease
MHRGVYAVGHAALPPLGPYAAALLAVGDGAVLSHASAAVVWRILPPEEGAAIHVSVTEGHPRDRKGIRVHRPSLLTRQEIRTREELSLTSPQRTLRDLATGGLSATTLERATSEAFAQRLIHEVPDHPRLRKGDPSRTRSEAERRLLRIIRQAGLPAPEVNARVAGFEVDLLWRTQRLIAEIDGWQFHGHRLAFERDRDKQQALAAAGFRVTRITWRQLDRPMKVAANLAQALAR